MEEGKCNTIRKRKSRENESPEHHETHIGKQHEKTWQKRAMVHHAYDRK